MAVKSVWVFPDNVELDDLEQMTGLQQACFEFLRFRASKTGPEGAALADSHVYLMNHSYFGGLCYSPAVADRIRQIVPEPYVTVSGRIGSGVAEALADADTADDAITAIVGFVDRIGFAGVDLNIEGIGQLTKAQGEMYFDFIANLSDAIHRAGLKFRFVTQAEGLYQHVHFNNEMLLALEPRIDYIVPMFYDAMYDLGSSEISPDAFARASIEKLLAQGWPVAKIIAGLANYAYVQPVGNDWSHRVIYPGEVKRLVGHRAGKRTVSKELYYQIDGNHIYYCDQESMDHQVARLKDYNLAGWCVWAAQTGGAWPTMHGPLELLRSHGFTIGNLVDQCIGLVAPAIHGTNV